MTATPEARPTPDAASDGHDGLDARYAVLVADLEANIVQVLDRVKPALSPEQRKAALAGYTSTARQALLAHLDALVGPALPVIKEACVAFNKIGYDPGIRTGDYNICKGDTVAVVTRLGSPESPGELLTHHPGCEKHAQMALYNLAATQTTITDYRAKRYGTRVFHSIIALADARRELRQTELAQATAAAKRLRWKFWRS